MNITNKALHWFTVLLLVIAYGKYIYFPFNRELTEQVYGSYPVWFPAFALMAVVWGFITITGIVLLKKWGLYMLLFSMIIGLIVVNILFDLSSSAASSYYVAVIFVIVSSFLNRRMYN